MLDCSLDDLARTYRGMLRAIARQYDVPGLDLEDIEQEAWFGLAEAARHYNGSRGVPFARFADRVIRLRLYDLGSRQGRHKHRPLNQAITTLRNEDGGEIELLEFVADRRPEPSIVAEYREMLGRMVDAMNNTLTWTERTALQGVLNDKSYDEIAAAIRGDRRAVDNAVQRARRKLRLAA